MNRIDRLFGILTLLQSRKFVTGEKIAEKGYGGGLASDGTKLIATNKRGQSVSIFELPSGKELARIPTKRKVVHGVAVSGDDRYAFISVEGIGSEPGTLEIIDLIARKTVATVDTPPQAAGIDFWKME